MFRETYIDARRVVCVRTCVQASVFCMQVLFLYKYDSFWPENQYRWFGFDSDRACVHQVEQLQNTGDYL